MSLAPEEIKAVQWLFAFMPERPVIVDVGANMGEWADIFLQEYKDSCHIFLYEPNDMLLTYCKVKYAYNKNITFHSIALSNKMGRSDFFYFENENNGLSSLYNNPKWDYLPKQKKIVLTSTLDQQCGSMEIDFLKIDTEGADMDVLEGARELLRNKKIKVIQIEYSEHWKLAGKSYDDLLKTQDEYEIYQWSDTGFIPVIEPPVEDCNLYLTYLPIQNLSTGWNKPFIENTKDIKFNLGIECGSAEGLTAKYMCENMLTGQDARLIVIDPLRDYYIKENDMPELVGQYQRWQANTKGLPINLYREKSETAWDKLKDLRPQFFYLDGDHSEEAVYNDGVNAIRIAESGAYILFDDYDGWSEATTRGIDRVLEKYSALIRVVKKNYQVLIQKI
jgi:FkbM family methyltransferase